MTNHRRLGLALIALLCFTTSGLRPLPAPAHVAGSWYVAVAGSPANDCSSPATACPSIGAAISKASSGDRILIASGIYTANEGSEVVTIGKSLDLSGGWEENFTIQSGMSMVDGERNKRVIDIQEGAIVVIDRLAIQNGWAASGAGIYNRGKLTLNHSVVQNNDGHGDFNDHGGGITNFHELTLNNTTILNNVAYRGGGIWNNGPLTINNSTISGNSADFCGGIENNRQVSLNNSTITNNTAKSGGGVCSYYTGFSLQNSIIAKNNILTDYARDCQGTLTSTGYSIVGNTTGFTGCNYQAGPGDQPGTDPKLGRLIGSPGYHHLLAGSPAIDAGNPGGCTDGAGLLLSQDQRGAERVGHCDIGAYEYTPAGPAAIVLAFSGTPQQTATLKNFSYPLQALALDKIGTPVSNIPVSLTAPAAGASVIFADTGTYTTTVNTDDNGVATSHIIKANCLGGSYHVIGTTGGADTTATFLLTNIAYLYLSQIARDYCPPTYFDDFSNPNSGWATGEDDFVKAEYTGGEYRVLSKAADYMYFFGAPTCDRQDYTVEVDARWVGEPGASYGIIFGIRDDFSQYYLFDINTDYQMFRLYYVDNDSAIALIQPNRGWAIKPGNATNHITVRRKGGAIQLIVNNVFLSSVWDTRISGRTGVGVVVTPYSDAANADARFDNFRISSADQGLLPTEEGKASSGDHGGFKPPIDWLLHPDLPVHRLQMNINR